jgi:beta-1,4-N-acetylglucosaminyltransferase
VGKGGVCEGDVIQGEESVKICLVCSHGGHLDEMLKLINAFEGYETVLVTYDAIFTKTLEDNCIRTKYLIEDLTLKYYKYRKNSFTKPIIILLHLLITSMRELKIVLHEKPNVIVSTGSEIALPMFFMGRLLGVKLVFIESLCRINSLSYTGKFVYPFCDLFLVQWKPLTERYKRAKYAGNVHKVIKNQPLAEKEEMIFVTVGTSPFLRLVKAMDEIAKRIEERVIMQIGDTNYMPRNAEFFTFGEYSKIRELHAKSKVVIAHVGVGSIMTSLEQGTPLIAVPRLKKYKELNDDHQLETAKVLAEERIINAVYDVDELEKALKDVPKKSINISKNDNLFHFLKSYLATLE